MKVLAAGHVLCACVVTVAIASVKNSGSSARERTSLLRAASANSIKAVEAAVAAKIGDVAYFGPHNCLSTWRNEDGHCEIATNCQARDLKDYPVKLMCVDGNGAKVRHVFTPGSFDPEESFDTLIACERCLADDTPDLTNAAVKEIPKPGGQDTSRAYNLTAEGDVDHGQLNALKDQVAELEGFMKKTSAQVKKLTAQVDSADTVNFNEVAPPANIPTAPPNTQQMDAPPLAAPLQQLVHESTAVRHRQGIALPVARETLEHDQDVDDEYHEDSERDADDAARMSLGSSNDADASEEDADGTQEQPSHEEEEVLPAETGDALLQRGGNQANDRMRFERHRSRHGAFLQRGRQEDDDLEDGEDHETEDRDSAVEDDDETERDGDIGNAAEDDGEIDKEEEDDTRDSDGEMDDTRDEKNEDRSDGEIDDGEIDDTQDEKNEDIIDAGLDDSQAGEDEEELSDA